VKLPWGDANRFDAGTDHLVEIASVQKRVIRNHYDIATLFYRLLWGPHIHHGYWESNESPAIAQLQLTENLARHAMIREGSTLYDIGCGAPLGTANGNNTFTPSRTYYNSITAKSISIFNNWDALPLFDSFTLIGHNVISNDDSVRTYSTVYFRLYLFNLFFKYNLFRFNTKLHEGTVKVRSQFEDFINTYNISHVSFNFLPNEIYFKIRNVLEIESELNKFQERIVRISTSIQENQQKKTNLLLGLVSFITGLSSVSPIIDTVTNLQSQLGLNPILFYAGIVILILVFVLIILYYLFPDKFKNSTKSTN
jgi:hypothetical protein